MHDDCDMCSNAHGTKWVPDSNSPIGGENEAFEVKNFDSMFMAHLMEIKSTGRYYSMNACFDVDQAVCATNLVLFAVHKAEPFWASVGEGYFGLGMSQGIQNNVKMNLMN